MILLVKLLAKACSNSTYILILPLLNSFNLTESVFPNFQQRPFHGLVCHLHVRKDWQTVYYTVNACSVISSIFHALTLVKIITFWIWLLCCIFQQFNYYAVAFPQGNITWWFPRVQRTRFCTVLLLWALSLLHMFFCTCCFFSH